MDISTQIGQKQIYENMEVIPIIAKDSFESYDLLDLKTGLEMGLVEVKECEIETVGTIIVVNNAATPLILIDGEQVKGAKQNRIINQTIIIPPKTEMKVPVSCTEQGRWTYKCGAENKSFNHSKFFASADVRKSKRRAMNRGINAQSEVWNSISDLQKSYSMRSPTSALSDVYESSKINKEEYLDNFSLEKNQIGVIVFINNKFKGIEILNSPAFYEKYHDMILNSYIIDAIAKKDEKTVGEDNLDDILDKVSNLDFDELNSLGLEKNYKASNDDIEGSISNFNNDLIHATYFKAENSGIGFKEGY